MRKGLQMNYILLVEDDTMIASGIIYALEMEGYEVCHAVTVADACGFIEKRYFDLAILDMQLPDGLGADIGNKLKNTERGCKNGTQKRSGSRRPEAGKRLSVRHWRATAILWQPHRTKPPVPLFLWLPPPCSRITASPIRYCISAGRCGA